MGLELNECAMDDFFSSFFSLMEAWDRHDVGTYPFCFSARSPICAGAGSLLGAGTGNVGRTGEIGSDLP